MFQSLLAGIVLVFALLGIYVHRRARLVFTLNKHTSRVVALIMLAGPVVLIASRRADFSDEVSRWLALVGGALTLGLIFSAFYLMHLDVGRAGLRIVKRLSRKQGAPDDARLPADSSAADGSEGDCDDESGGGVENGNEVESSDEAEGVEVLPDLGAALEGSKLPRTLSRREAILSGAAVLAGPSTSTYASLLGRHDYEISEVVLRLPGWPRALDGFTLVQVSDIHIGTFVGEWELAAAVDLVRQARGDLVVLTGDLLDHEARFAPRLGQLVRALEPLTANGVIACMGNHDHYAGVDTVMAAVRGGGARVLRNEGTVIGDGGGAFALLGVEDLWAPGPGAGPDLDAALMMVPSDLPRVLLCHQPEFFHDNAGSVQLQLSGHTHGGQLALGYNPAQAILPHGYVRGEYQRAGGQLYVNRGFGTSGPPARLGSPPEVAKIILTG